MASKYGLMRYVMYCHNELNYNDNVPLGEGNRTENKPIQQPCVSRSLTNAVTGGNSTIHSKRQGIVYHS
jgi:hypothetical protein